MEWDFPVALLNQRRKCSPSFLVLSITVIYPILIGWCFYTVPSAGVFTRLTGGAHKKVSSAIRMAAMKEASAVVYKEGLPNGKMSFCLAQLKAFLGLA